MKSWKKTVIWILIVVFCSSASFIVGSYKAFWAGWAWNKEDEAAVEGAVQVSVLRCLRKGNTDEAMKIEETIIDGKIFDYAIFSKQVSVFDYLAFLPRNPSGPTMMGLIAKYRKEYPSTATSEMRKTIDKTLAKFIQEEPKK
jgi:hypothetical protein